ncbi:hypothetical protein HTZ77_37490 [Nonomuraea sp. SMC257]|uniref:Uncharacterized protein n=1 Tax=Nonomuraea montanisoli TaxID=2741721 RepID=A0A7Y6IF50_9ACTN|nr:hypothetical protein [Nonomuraea montanisoli]NUW37057.1 hypothetical protein [Nonomuraea montanisoli]
MDEILRVDQRSLLDARLGAEDMEDRLERVARRALITVSAPEPADREQPGAEFDAEYARFVRHAATAFDATLREVREHARKLRETARTHASASGANEDLVRRLADGR